MASKMAEAKNVFRVCIPWYKHSRGWETPRQLCKPETKICLTVENSPHPSSVYIRLCKQRKKVFYSFYEIFLKTNSTNEGINLLIQKDFLNSRSRQSSFLLTNQNAHLITHEPMGRLVGRWMSLLNCLLLLCWKALSWSVGWLLGRRLAF